MVTGTEALPPWPKVTNKNLTNLRKFLKGWVFGSSILTVYCTLYCKLRIYLALRQNPKTKKNIYCTTITAKKLNTNIQVKNP
jgi:hypothetical protein